MSVVRMRRIPRPSHEARVRLLCDLADVQGCHLRLSLPDGRRPDVARFRASPPSLFFGEAKASEGPDDLKALDRMAAYLRWQLMAVQAGGRAVFAIAHPPGLERQWRASLYSLIHGMALGRTSVRSRRITLDSSVTYVSFAEGSS